MSKFNIGQLTATRGVIDMANNDPDFAYFIGSCVADFQNCNWGDTCAEDSKMNDEAISSGGRIFAVYKYSDEVSIRIITEFDRMYTTILFPEEY